MKNDVWESTCISGHLWVVDTYDRHGRPDLKHCTRCGFGRYLAPTGTKKGVPAPSPKRLDAVCWLLIAASAAVTIAAGIGFASIFDILAHAVGELIGYLTH